MKTNLLKSTKTWIKDLSIGYLELIFSSIFAIILSIGYLLTAKDILQIKVNLVAVIFGFIATWVISLYGILVVKKISSNINIKEKPKPFNAKLWITLSIIIFLFYIPLTILGVSTLTVDSWSSLSQISGDLPLTNAHPVIFTGFLGIFMSIGSLFDNFNLGIALFTTMQSAILAMIFALTIVYIKGLGAPKLWLMGIFIFYAIIPINAIAGIILWKDILFAALGLLLVIQLWHLSTNKTEVLTIGKMIVFIFTAFLFCVWRNNGFYAYTAMVILLLIINYRPILHGKFMRYLIILITPIVLFFTYTATVYITVGTPSSSETMSVPLQQIARTVKLNGNSLSDEDRQKINEILPYNELPELYNPGLSDPVKSAFKNEVFNRDKLRYINLWFKLLSENPGTFIAAFTYNTYGYFYPFHVSPTPTDIIIDNTGQIFASDEYVDEVYASGIKTSVILYRDIVTSTASILRNIGLYTCIFILSIYVSIIRKRRDLIAPFALLGMLLLTTILGPVNGEFRYLYMFVLTTPFIVTCLYIKKQQDGLISKS